MCAGHASNHSQSTTQTPRNFLAARRQKLLPLPRPTYTEFVNRARAARMPDRLDFLYVPADAPQPPPWASFAPYERVVWCGVSFRHRVRG